ncbi:MAG: hypothetical protein NPIRA05_17130 [Nitrospirales bacterium]|nr:MAG: hypothetical protein NPIRA05_17130 [Nitrospirales bacterium]
MQPTLWVVACVGVIILLIALHSMQTAFFLLIFSMLFSPEIAVGDAVGGGVGGRPVTFRLDDLLLIVIGFTWLVKMVVDRDLPVFKRTPLNRPILYYVLVCVFSTMVGMLTGHVNPRVGFFWVLKYFEYFFLFFMVINHITTKAQVIRCLVAALVVGFLVSLFAIGQIPSGERATALFEGKVGEPNTLGGYLVLMMAIVIGLMIYMDSLLIRGGLSVLLVCLVIALLATLSRTSYITAVVLALIVLVSHWKNPLVIGTVLAGALVLVLFAPSVVTERVLFTVNQDQHLGQVQIGGWHLDTSTSDRIKGWQKLLSYWVERPLFGKGVASVWWADSQYVKVLAETGLFGLTAFLFISVRLWRGARVAFEKAQDSWEKGLAYGFLLGMIAMLVHALAANTFSIVRIMEPFWLLAGLVMLIPMLKRQSEFLEPSPANDQAIA